jgi:hypothetical protein
MENLLINFLKLSLNFKHTASLNGNVVEVSTQTCSFTVECNNGAFIVKHLDTAGNVLGSLECKKERFVASYMNLNTIPTAKKRSLQYEETPYGTPGINLAVLDSFILDL